MDIASLAVRVHMDGLDVVERGIGGLSSKGAQAERSMLAMAGKIAAVGAAAAAAGAAIYKMAQTADEFRLMAARINVAAGSMNDGAAAMGQLYRISQQLQVGIGETAQVFTRLNQSILQMGGNQQDTLRLTELLGKAIKTSGASAAEAQSAMLQFGQALGSGQLAGDELKSLMESAPYLMRKLADGLGVPIGALKQLGAEGKLTADVVVNAMGKAAAKIESDFGQMPHTISGAMTVADNAMKLFAKGVDEGSAASVVMTGAIAGMAEVVDSAAASMLGLGGSSDQVARNKEIQKWTSDVANGFSYVADMADVAWQTLSVLGRNVAFVFKGIGNEVGGIGAQIAALARGDIAGAIAIGKMMKDDAAKARSELDKADAATLGKRMLAGERYRQEQEALKKVDPAKGPLSAMDARLAGSGTFSTLKPPKSAYQTVVDKYTPTSDKINEDIAKIKDGIAKGVITREDGAKLLAEANKKLLKASSAGDHGAAKKEVSAYATLISAIKAKTAENEKEVSVGVELSESQKLRIQLDQDLAAGKLKLTSAHKTAVLAELASLEASEKAVAVGKTQKEIDEYIAQGTLIRKESAAQLAIEYQLYGQSADAREIALVAIKAEAEAEKLLADLKKKGGPVSQQQIDQINAEATARAKVEQATLAQTKALGYAQQLADENERFAAESLINEQDRAYAILQIDARKWEERIKLAGDGTEAQKKLQEQYNTWYANQLNKPAIDEWKKSVEQYDTIFRQGFADMVNGGKDTWKSFTKSLTTTFKTSVADQIYKMFAQPFVVKIIGSLLGVTGSGEAMAGGGTAGTGTGGGLDFGSVLSLGKNAYNWGSSYFAGSTAVPATYSYGSESAGWAAMQNGADASLLSGAGATYGYASESAGWAAMQNGADSSLLASQGAGSSGVSTGAAGVSGWVSAGSTLIGSMAGNYAAAKWGKQTPSGQRAGSYGAAGGAAAGAYYGSSFGPWGTLIGAVAGGILGAVGASQLFGHGGDKTGGNYNASYSASGQLAQDQFFGGYTPNQADGDLKQYVQGVKDSYQSLVTLLGGDAKALTINLGYDTDPQGTAGNRVSAQLAMYQQPAGLDSASAEKALQANSLLNWSDVAAGNLQEKLTEATVRMLLLALQNSNIDEEYRKVLDGKDIAKMSEAEVQSLTQQLQYRKQLNDAFKDLGKVMPQLSGMAFDMKDQFVGLFGGMQNLTAALGDYYQNFYSDSERRVVTQQHIAESLQEVNLTLPKTRAEFRRMVEGLDLTTDAGQKAYTVMMQVSGAFASVTEAISSFDSDWSGLVSQANQSYQQSLQDQISGYQSIQSAATSAFNSIKQALDSLKLGSLSTLSPEQKLAEARRQFDEALGKARSGDMTAAGNLSGLGQTLLEQSRNYNASGVGYVSDYNSVTDALQSVGAVAQTTADAAQRQIDLLNSQLNVQTSAAKSLDKIVNQMADLIFNTGKMGDLASLLSGLPPGIANPIVSAVSALAASTISGAYQQYLGRAPDQGGIDYYTNQLKGGATPSTVVDAIKNSPEAQLQAAYQSALGRAADSAGLSWYMGAIADGSKTLDQALSDIKYAGVNGSHASGLAYVPFDGYIAELHKGERVLTAEETRRYGTGQRTMATPVDYSRMGRGDGLTQALIQRVEQMTEELRQLRAERREGDQMAARQRNDQARQQQKLAQLQQRGIARLAADSI